MYRNKWRRLLGLCAVSFGLGIFASYFLPGFILAFLEAVALIVAGCMLIGATR